jgi:glycosyltransferase involved in cell wall biosynthesis/GT2 family glycosyltransferase
VRVLRVSHSASVAQWRGRERALRAAGVDVALLTATEWHAGGARETLVPEAGEQVQGVRTFGSHPALFLYDPRPLWRALGEPWEVVDIHEEPFALATAEILLLRALRRSAAPVVLYTAQNIRKRYPIPFRWLERWALRTASGVSACNRDAAAIVVDKGFAGRPRVIPLGVDLERFRPRPPADTDGERAQVTVGYLGRFVEEKGIDVLLDAVRREPALAARLAGAGPLLSHVQRRIREEGLSGRVEVIGTVAPDLVPEFFGSVDVVAIPSIPTPTWTEQFGRVAVEAMACGVPVVSSDAGALPEVVGGAGVVVRHSSPADLAQGLLAAAGPDRDRLRRAGLERARTCSWRAVADDYISLYGSVTGGESAAGPRGVEIVVVAYGALPLLRDALAPLTGLPVTVVDNSSQPEIAALCAASGIRYIDPGENRGFAAGVNTALADRLDPAADVLLLNPDARIDPAGLARLQEALRADRRLASVGPAQVDDEGRRSRVEWHFPSPANAWLEALGLGRLQFGARFAIGSVLLLRAEALAAVGGLDERFFLYAEETDWAYRAHRLGWRHAAVPEVSAVHIGGATSTDPRRREAHFFASQERYFRKHYGTLGWQLTRAACWVGATLRAGVLSGDRRAAARRRAALYRRGPVRVEARFRARSA